MAFPFTPSNQTATGAAGVLTLTIPATAGSYCYCTGFAITGLGATAASGVTATLTGVSTTPLNYSIPVPAGVTAGITPLVVKFPLPLQSTAVNTAIVLSIPSFGAGNTLASASMTGYIEE